MTSLVVFDPADNPLALPPEEAEAARQFIAEQLAKSTRKAYVSDNQIFVAWCEARGLSPLPADPATVATFLAAEATAGLKYATIARRAAAINFLHETAGQDSPTKSNLVSATLKGIRRSIGVAPNRKTPATALRVMEMVRYCPPTLKGQRDKALLLLGFAGAFRRSELVALAVEDLESVAEGLRVTIRKSKTDQERAGQVVAIPRGEVHCPVAAVQGWREAAGIHRGHLFRPVGKGGRVGETALSTKSVVAIIKAYAELAGLNPAEYAGHSLRAGFLTSAAEAGASLFKMIEVSRHRSLDTVRGYVRHADLFKKHAGTGLL